ncbi:hypothetical protein DEO23_02910 [Brachybacterium endophyticum]|uniref:Acyl-CoA:diacylglycerol acyltransferase n=1 Tax=Brachybacterium endophyticum TaxID=2182385 RepID=A0A2U2RNZ1_9MICO|nr:alpha/beta hydrolase family protein [Brachybacterium endophyticum]PWH07593.1 hypothetical protein DEO23_02910 [Brachybacterium endophyticum]
MTLSAVTPERASRVARPSRRALLAGTAAATGLLAAPVTAHASTNDPFDASNYHSCHGLDFVDGFPVPIPDWRSVDFRVNTEKVQTFPPSFRVTLPTSYRDSPDRNYPVLLLLHGRGGNFTQWTQGETGEGSGNGGDVISRTADQDVIVVMPDGGAGSFYSNAYHAAPGRRADWETFLIDQVLPFVHENFRTDPSRMAVAGDSMGGWGALSLGQKYQDLFRSISAYSGLADCRPDTLDGGLFSLVIWIGPALEAKRYPFTANGPGSIWGNDLDPDIASTYNPIENLERYRGKRLFLRNGDGNWIDFAEALKGHGDLYEQLRDKQKTIGQDVVEGDVSPNLERFADALTDAGIEHDHKMLKGRTHEFGLWQENFAEDLPGIMKALEA